MSKWQQSLRGHFTVTRETTVRRRRSSDELWGLTARMLRQSVLGVSCSSNQECLATNDGQTCQRTINDDKTDELRSSPTVWVHQQDRWMPVAEVICKQGWPPEVEKLWDFQRMESMEQQSDWLTVWYYWYCTNIIRPHHSIKYVDVAYSYRPSSVVCWSVTLVSLAKTAAPV